MPPRPSYITARQPPALLQNEEYNDVHHQISTNMRAISNEQADNYNYSNTLTHNSTMQEQMFMCSSQNPKQRTHREASNTFGVYPQSSLDPSLDSSLSHYIAKKHLKGQPSYLENPDVIQDVKER